MLQPVQRLLIASLLLLLAIGSTACQRASTPASVSVTTPGTAPSAPVTTTSTCTTQPTSISPVLHEVQPHLLATQPLATPPASQSYDPSYLAFSPDGRYLLVARLRHLAVYQVMLTPEPVRLVAAWTATASTAATLNDLALLDAGRLALAWSDRVEVRTLADGVVQWQQSRAGPDEIATSIAVTADHQTLAVGWAATAAARWTRDGHLTLYDLAGGAPQQPVTQRGIERVALLPDNQRLVLVWYGRDGEGASLRYRGWLDWRERDSGLLLHREQLFETHLTSLPRYRFSPAGDLLAGYDGYGGPHLQLRALPHGCPVTLTALPLPTTSELTDVAFSSNGTMLVATTGDGYLAIWPTHPNRAGCSFRADETTRNQSGAAVSATGHLVAFVNPTGDLRLWSIDPSCDEA